MTNSITVDPMEPNGLHSSLYPTQSLSSQPMSLYNMQSMMQMQVMNTVMRNLSFLQTGNPMIDTILTTMVQAIIITLVGLAVSQITSIITSIKNFFNNMSIYSWYFLYNCFYFIKTRVLGIRARKIIRRNVDIPYISDNRQINELYKAVFWFLTNNSEIDYLHEPYLQYVFDKKITIETKEAIKQNLAIHKILTQQKTKEIEYKNHKIKYSLSTELITVYTDKDRKRENFKVSLSTDVDEFEQTDVLEQFCQNCLTEYINNLTSSTWTQLIYTNSGTEWKSASSNNTRKLDTIILKKGLKEELKNDLQLFLNSEDWYKERDIPYTRGYLFYGYPGTGKTSMIKGMSLYSKRHIHFLMLSEVKSDSELLELFKKINYKDTVLVIEDIDATIEAVKSRDKKEKEKEKEETDTDSDENMSDDEKRKRKNRENEEKSKLTLSGLLNALDGVFQCHGRILIMTTNHPEVLDSALIRPGRIDSKYLFDNCNRDQIKGLYEMFFNQPADNDHIDLIKNDNYSPAHITSVFLRYRNKPKDALLHLDDVETKIQILSMVKAKEEEESNKIIKKEVVPNKIINKEVVITENLNLFTTMNLD
jgi:AAA+ superfamily predicted ATPase